MKKRGVEWAHLGVLLEVIFGLKGVSSALLALLGRLGAGFAPAARPRVSERAALPLRLDVRPQAQRHLPRGEEEREHSGHQKPTGT